MIGDKVKKLIFIGGDHASVEAKKSLYKHLEDTGFEVTDLGTFTTEACDYPDFAREVGEKVKEHADSFGILICGSGIGMSMAANKMQGIRCALANDENMAELSRRHNNANVLAMGARIITPEVMAKVTDKFLNTAFESGEERHVRRVRKIDEM